MNNKMAVVFDFTFLILRELIFTEPDIIATPSFGDDCSITLIVQASIICIISLFVSVGQISSLY